MSSRMIDWLRTRLHWLAPDKPLGLRGEDAAARFLRGRGYKIVARGDRSSLGELDIVAVDGRTVVFVEVKTREDLAGGDPLEAVDAAKQRRLSRVATGWLKRHGLLGSTCRFDVVSVHWPQGVRRPQIVHVERAFESAGSNGFFS